MELTSKERRLAERLLAVLVDEPLDFMNRILGMQRFKFGPQEWSLLVTCRWRIKGPDGFELGWDDFVPERRDDHAEPFYKLLGSDPLVVESLQVGEDGGLEIRLNRGYSMRFEPESQDDDPGWGWRFMYPNHLRGLYVGQDGFSRGKTESIF